MLEAYRLQPTLIAEHANLEEDTARGGYAHRQLLELVQNGADALAGSGSGRIWLRLAPTHLYCADEGQPIDSDGVRALMFSHLSGKRGTMEIGRFGLGFKSVLGVTDSPEFFSRSGSFRFDRAKASELIRPIVPEAERYPVLRLPEAVDPWPEMKSDPILCDLMGWATNIVRLPLKPGAHEGLGSQIRDFPPEFLLFVEHVSELTLENVAQDDVRRFSLQSEGAHWLLETGGDTTRWMLISARHPLSPEAKDDSRSLDDADEVQISWAAPIDRLNDPGKFWAFFPTLTTSLLSGILNAPWKTNEDRQNLLPGDYNDELIDAAAALVADALPGLSTPDDPAGHLDALPRREETGDTKQSMRLRLQLNSILRDTNVVPNQEGELRRLLDVSYPPRELTPDRQMALAPFERWAAYEGRPSNWLHHTALTTIRRAKLDQLNASRLPSATIAEWLESLTKNTESQDTAVQASAAAIQTAALIPEHLRKSNDLGNIVLTAVGQWTKPNPDAVFLGDGSGFGRSSLVHPQLQAHPKTLEALRELGIRPASSESVFKEAVSNLLKSATASQDGTHTDERWREFWKLARDVDQPLAARIIRESDKAWRNQLRVRTLAGKWRSLFQTLLPGSIVPEDGSRDSDVAIDVQFHEADLSLLKQLDVANTPYPGHELSEDKYRQFTGRCRNEFSQPQRGLLSTPRWDKLNFEKSTTSGPLDVLKALSDEGKLVYTSLLLSLPSTYERWTMRHDTQVIYPPLKFESPAVEELRQHGRIKTDEGILNLSDGLGDPPQSWPVLYKLLSHPQAGSIRSAFGLSAQADTSLDPVGEDDPSPLVDVWPGLKPHLTTQQHNRDLIRCDGFQQLGEFQGEDKRDCIIKSNFVYVTRKDDERDELTAVLQVLGLQLNDEQIERILRRQTPADIQAARDAVRSCSTDEERLLAAVGETELRRRLPQGLVGILRDTQNPRPLTGIQVAQAAIATFHTGALREYRHKLGHLGPPLQWAGRPPAVEFVQSLGFGVEWAGDRNTRRDPYVEVEGPYSLPELHGYQRNVVENMRRLLHSNGTVGERRGMISMPTGSGKTRVAVQAIVEAIREDGFEGGILWVADRDELCEQAVESWRQVWSSEGTQATSLRISRMWAGQPPPRPTSEMHVIVATIQTLSAKIARQPESYEFLTDYKLLVFDEAHRSVAPTFTSVMTELGLTRWRREREPFLVGLTATPYRGHDAEETARLVNRYGSNRLDSGAFENDDPEDVIRELQAMRVLAQADHETIEGGSFSLSEDELRQSTSVPWLPRSVENRIADDADRTLRIVQAYMNYIDRDWPTLIFATSVEHSQIVAALLTAKGVDARAVSATTDTSSRRRIVDKFRSGEIKALVNYGIFREGFDAPKTRAIIVARPVYSPNLYFQMIGRGLRGVKNGGNDRCLILNVKDNIENFQRKLAFSDLDWLWA